MARRDFTVNAIARPPGRREIVDPFDGVGDLAAARAADRLPGRASARTRFGILRGSGSCRSSASPAGGDRGADARGGPRPPSRLGRADRGGLAADGLGELSKLLLGIRPLMRSGSHATRAHSSSSCPSSRLRSATTSGRRGSRCRSTSICSASRRRRRTGMHRFPSGWRPSSTTSASRRRTRTTAITHSSVRESPGA